MMKNHNNLESGEYLTKNDRKYETFVPLYITNYCDSRCRICNMRAQNGNLMRVEGSADQIASQLRIILEVEGISSICILSGEFISGTKRVNNLALVIWCIKEALKMGFEKVYFNIGALHDDEIKMFSDNFAGNEHIVLSLFQETYHKDCYKKIFGYNDANNPKSDYVLRITTPERWLQTGFMQVDLGILLGLREPEYDLRMLIDHATNLNNMGATVHISLPRIKGIKKVPYKISDQDFKRIISTVATHCPWAKLIITTREDISMIKELLAFITVISPGSSDVLPYTKIGDIPNNLRTSQFQVEPVRKRPSYILDSLGLDNGSILYYSS
jgi:2-iminoacetate synthase ThiH